MARSYSSLAGVPSPWLMGAIAVLAITTVFGPETGLFDGGPESRLAALSGIDDELAPAEPLQRAIRAPERPLLDPDFVATPLHAFTAEALVLSRKSYRHDAEAAISPLDLMLGWGPMSNPAVVSQISMRQSGRFGYVRTGPEAQVDLDALSPFWTNAHLIPATPDIAEAMAGIAEGAVIRLEGTLVNVYGPDGWRWRTSTSRTDAGAGACEIVLVTAIHILR